VYAGALKMRKKWVRLKRWRDKKSGEDMVSFWINGKLVHTTNLSDTSDSIIKYLNREQKISDSNGSQKEEMDLNGTDKADN
jgi:predicted transcriptional regulator